jgi:hypothetical protein
VGRRHPSILCQPCRGLARRRRGHAKLSEVLFVETLRGTSRSCRDTDR